MMSDVHETALGLIEGITYACFDLYDVDHETCFPANMLFWHKGGFLCEDCFDYQTHCTFFQRGRSLEDELLLKKSGHRVRKLPEPFYQCSYMECEYVWRPKDLWHKETPEGAHYFYCDDHYDENDGEGDGKTLAAILKENEMLNKAKEKI